MLKVTNANVCASIVLAKSFFASKNGMASTERNSCGMNASDSICIPAASEGYAELRCSTVL